MSLRSAMLGSQSSFTPAPAVSDAEAEMLMQIGMEDLAEAQQIDRDLVRLEDTAVALEGLVEVCDHITEAKPSELMLIESATELALAGTGAKAEEVVPGLESAEGTVVSTEGVKEVIQNIWKTIKDFIKKMWRKVTSFFKKIRSGIPKLRKEAEKLKKRAEDAASKSTEESKIELGSLANVLRKGSSHVSAGQDLTDHAEDYALATSVLLEDYSKAVKEAGDGLAEEMGKYEPKSDVAGLKALNGKGARVIKKAKATFGKVKGMTAVNGGKIDGFREPLKKDILHGRSLVVEVADFKEESENRPRCHDGARFLQGIKVNVVPTIRTDDEALTDGEMEILTTNQCVEIADHIISICDTIDSFEGGKTLKELVKSKDKMEAATSKKDGKVSKTTDLNGEQTTSWRIACGYNAAYARWATGPQSMWQHHALTVCRAMLAAGNKSLSQYK